MGREHASILSSSAAADLAVCCDTNIDAAAAVPPGCAFTTSLDEALDVPGLEAAFIATPPSNHLPALRAAVERNLAVFCEKPIADSLTDAELISTLARHAVRPVVIGHMFRFEPRYRSIHEAISAGRLGRMIHLSVRGYTPDFEGRQLAGRTTLAVENGIHGIDVLRWMGGEIERVYAEASRAAPPELHTEDAIAATVRFASGAIGTLESDWALPSVTGLLSVDSLTVVGGSGVAWVDERDSGAAIFSAGAAPEFPRRMPAYRDPAASPYGLYRMEDEYFLAAVRDGRPWPLTVGDAEAALRVALAINRSIVEGRPVGVAEPDL
jgi:predicted dehydrogenase